MDNEMKIMTSYSSYSRYSYRLTYETVQKCYEMFTKSSVPLFSSSQIRQFKRQLARSQFHKHHDICLDKLIVELRFYKNIEILNDILPYDIIKQLERRYLISPEDIANILLDDEVLGVTAPPPPAAQAVDEVIVISDDDEEEIVYHNKIITDEESESEEEGSISSGGYEGDSSGYSSSSSSDDDSRRAVWGSCLVSLQVTSGGSIISNAVVFEYKKRSNIDESQFHNFCNIKEEQYNQYMYENDTLLKFILIHRIESIQDDAYTHGSSLVNKYEVS
ncbi:hypothetical protein V9T40_009646 [Parthenolecanium corni]|uniref:Uncharacterized protein n=1 Tax=Parthenolecanium corni TaxID=536013 RepID=A0AAN9TN64_9HEMI